MASTEPALPPGTDRSPSMTITPEDGREPADSLRRLADPTPILPTGATAAQEAEARQAYAGSALHHLDPGSHPARPVSDVLADLDDLDWSAWPQHSGGEHREAGG